MSWVVTVLAAATAAWLSVSPGPTLRRGAGHAGVAEAAGWARSGRPASGGRLGVVPALVVAVLAGGVLVLLDGATLVLALVLLGAAAGGWWLALAARRRKQAAVTAGRVVDVCEAVAGELRAGQPPAVALRRCVEVWDRLEPVAAAAELGADVPGALRRLARAPGAGGLADVAAAWRVSELVGGSMAVALGQVAENARARRAGELLVASELASARATARLVAALPVVVLAAGSGLGGDPWRFLLATPAGLVCLGAGVGLTFAGLAWIERLAAGTCEP